VRRLRNIIKGNCKILSIFIIIVLGGGRDHSFPVPPYRSRLTESLLHSIITRHICRKSSSLSETRTIFSLTATSVHAPQALCLFFSPFGR
jgi:hypothetical protein